VGDNQTTIWLWADKCRMNTCIGNSDSFLNYFLNKFLPGLTVIKLLEHEFHTRSTKSFDQNTLDISDTVLWLAIFRVWSKKITLKSFMTARPDHYLLWQQWCSIHYHLLWGLLIIPSLLMILFLLKRSTWCSTLTCYPDHERTILCSHSL